MKAYFIKSNDANYALIQNSRALLLSYGIELIEWEESDTKMNKAQTMFVIPANKADKNGEIPVGRGVYMSVENFYLRSGISSNDITIITEIKDNIIFANSFEGREQYDDETDFKKYGFLEIEDSPEILANFIEYAFNSQGEGTPTPKEISISYQSNNLLLLRRKK